MCFTGTMKSGVQEAARPSQYKRLFTITKLMCCSCNITNTAVKHQGPLVVYLLCLPITLLKEAPVCQLSCPVWCTHRWVVMTGYLNCKQSDWSKFKQLLQWKMLISELRLPGKSFLVQHPGGANACSDFLYITVVQGMYCVVHLSNFF